jgi:hypothetical protein
VRDCLTDEGRPLGIGLQEQIPNHLRRLWPKGYGRERGRKRPGLTGSGVRQEEDRKETTVEVSKPTSDDVKTAALLLLRDKLRRYLFTGGAASGMRGGLGLP